MYYIHFEDERKSMEHNYRDVVCQTKKELETILLDYVKKDFENFDKKLEIIKKIVNKIKNIIF